MLLVHELSVNIHFYHFQTRLVPGSVEQISKCLKWAGLEYLNLHYFLHIYRYRDMREYRFIP